MTNTPKNQTLPTAIMKDYEFDHKTYEQESKDKVQVSFVERDPDEGFRLTVSILSEQFGDSKRAISLNVSAADFFEEFHGVQWNKFITMGERINGSKVEEDQ